MSVKDFSTTPASNATVGSINFAELQVPSSLNDSARNLMADIAEWYAQLTGGTMSGTVGGTGDAITLTTTPATTYTSNRRFLVKAPGANTITAPTLNVSGLGVKTIKLPGGSALGITQYGTNDMLLLAYDGTDFILLSGDRSRGSSAVQSLIRNAQVGTSYTILTGDRSKHLTFSNAASIAVTQPQANGSTFGGGWYYWAENIGAGTVTITPTTSTINGGTALVLRTGEWALITSDDTNYRTFTNGRVTGAASVRELGTRGLPIQTQDAAYGFVIGDEGSIVRHTSATPHTYTIPANGSVAFPIGTAITVINEPAAGDVTIAITTDTLNRGDGTAGTGNRIIAKNCVATLIKTTATTWIITGSFT